jgi:RNA polymerase sigma factor (sigma-70 family)
VNCCRTHQRKAIAKRRLLLRFGQAKTAATAAAADQQMEHSERNEQVRKAIGQLSRTDREVIVLHYLEELDVKQICEITGKRSGAISTRLHRARKRLKQLLGDALQY